MKKHRYGTRSNNKLYSLLYRLLIPINAVMFLIYHVITKYYSFVPYLDNKQADTACRPL